MGSHHSHYLGSGELRNVQSDALCFIWTGYPCVCCGSVSFPAVPFRWVWILLNNCIVLNGLSPLPLSRQW